MASPLEICNKALRLLGRSPIASFDDDTIEAFVMKTMYEPAKQQVLRSYEWNCAKREEDALISDTPNYAEFDFQFPWPVDCLRVLDICDATGYTNPLLDVDGVVVTDEFGIVIDPDGNILVTN